MVQLSEGKPEGKGGLVRVEFWGWMYIRGRIDIRVRIRKQISNG